MPSDLSVDIDVFTISLNVFSNVFLSDILNLFTTLKCLLLVKMYDALYFASLDFILQVMRDNLIFIEHPCHTE